MSEAGAAAGGRVVGRYVLYDELAAGGMATVHIGRLVGEVGFSRSVAIKRLHPQFAHDPEFVAMFMEEARLAARIRHPNVVPVLDVSSADDELFLVMEYIQGETLTRLTRVARNKNRIIPTPIALAIAADMLAGLHAAHEAEDENGQPLHIVHRDVSPHNVMVGHDGVARVLDFGIAKASSSASATRDGEVRGKFAYMSPEQLSATKVDRRADVFAASIVLWEMLTGQRLFQAGDPAGIVGLVLHGTIKPPGMVVGGIPPAIDALVMKGLERNATQRFASAAAMGAAIENAGLQIARPAEVGAWVNRIAGDTLKKRARRIAEIESTGSHSREIATAAAAALSGSHGAHESTSSRSKSGLRARSEPHISAPAFPWPPPSDSQPIQAFAEPAPAPAPPAPRKSSAGTALMLFAMLGALGGVAYWQRARITSLIAPPQAVGVSMGESTTATAKATAPTATTSVVMVVANGEVVDVTNDPNKPAPTARQRTRTHTTPGATADPTPTATEVIPQGTPQNQHPSQAQIQMALGPVMPNARACLLPDDQPSRASVTFQSDGTVKGVSVTGYAAGKPQEACIKSALTRARSAAFLDATYTLPVTIRP